MESAPPAPPDDALLLRRRAREGSQAAFRALAERHLPLVWSTAWRLVRGDGRWRRTIAQRVPADFARKAALPPDMTPAGPLSTPDTTGSEPAPHLDTAPDRLRECAGSGEVLLANHASCVLASDR